jgi:chromosome segregation ATPase
MTPIDQIENRKQALRGGIENFKRSLRSAEQKAEFARAAIRELKAELLEIIENEDEIAAFVEECEHSTQSV